MTKAIPWGISFSLLLRSMDQRCLWNQSLFDHFHRVTTELIAGCSQHLARTFIVEGRNPEEAPQ
jgi:hypothetical protein